MKVLIASDFYYEYELYETDDIDDLKDTIRRMAAGEDVEPDASKHILLAYDGDGEYWLDEVKAEADETIFLSDLIEDEECINA